MSIMDKLAAVLEKYLLPVAQKVGTQRHLLALRDGFVATMTASILGAMVVFINCVFLQSDGLIGKYLNELSFWHESIQPALDSWVMQIGWNVQTGTLKVLSLLVVISISYSLAKSYDGDGLGAAITSVGCYFALLPSTLGAGFFHTEKVDDVSKVVDGVSDVFQVGHFGTNAMFAAMITAFLATEIFVRVGKKGWTIKMPDGVPPAVSRSFAALVPGSLALILFGIISVIFNVGLNECLPDFILHKLQAPLMNLGQSPAVMVLLALLAQLLWFFGIHGINVIDSVLKPLYYPCSLANIDATSKGEPLPYVLTRNFIDVYAMPGGCGGTLALLIAIAIFSKKQEEKEIFKLAIAPGVFQINEPVIFGLPIILNVTYFIPWILSTPLMLLLAWVFTGPIPFAARIGYEVPWTCPPVISALMATGFDWKAGVLAFALLVFAIFLWAPFIIAANKMGNGEQA
ncbi:MAG: PTS transporter subunit EIIC [Clostridiaceae bacterium]|nr:PTS transporter subunit EIIC [Clostridiaceae bacterium]